MAAIDTIHGTGALQTTSRTLDLAISGDGFFQVADSADESKLGFSNTQYTRAGNFYMDANGYLVNSDGKYLVGYDADTFLLSGGKRLKEDGTELDINATTPPTQEELNAAWRIEEGKLVVGNPAKSVQVTYKTKNSDVEINLATGSLTFKDDNGKSYTITDTATGDIVDENGQAVTDKVTFTPAQFDTVFKKIISPEGKVTFESALTELKPIKIPTTAQSMSIGQDGSINFVDKDGVLLSAGKIQLAKFPNTGGLEKIGSNYYQKTANSGEPVFGFATESGIGSIESGFLEMSNVDLSEEFTEMIVAQRGFQANSRIITTSDQILEELVNLKR